MELNYEQISFLFLRKASVCYKSVGFENLCIICDFRHSLEVTKTEHKTFLLNSKNTAVTGPRHFSVPLPVVVQGAVFFHYQEEKFLSSTQIYDLPVAENKIQLVVRPGPCFLKVPKTFWPESHL